jgi:exonuclease SbcC
MRREALLADNVAQARRRNQDEAQLAARVEKVRENLSRYYPNKPSSLADLLTGLIHSATTHIGRLREREERRRLIVRRLATHIDKLDQADRHKVIKEAVEERMKELHAASNGVDRIREAGKALANAARHARANIVGRVFNTALNKVWRDLFVRLAPQEKFVPAFKLASSSDEPVEAGLETVHRSGEKGGPPGTMLSAGNLNTAALTLFLALHLSVKNRLPWIILDDPVQSMDDVHISQFAALLRTFAKNLGRQIIIAVHDRALFDYLALELSPAFQDDRLITVELSRTLAGESVGIPKVITFAPDEAIAA